MVSASTCACNSDGDAGVGTGLYNVKSIIVESDSIELSIASLLIKLTIWNSGGLPVPIFTGSFNMKSFSNDIFSEVNS